MSNQELMAALGRAIAFLDTVPDSGMLDEESGFSADDFRLTIDAIDPREVSPAIPRHDLGHAAPPGILFRYGKWKAE